MFQASTCSRKFGLTLSSTRCRSSRSRQWILRLARPKPVQWASTGSFPSQSTITSSRSKSPRSSTASKSGTKTAGNYRESDAYHLFRSTGMSQAHALLIDDNRQNLRVLRQLLTKQGVTSTDVLNASDLDRVLLTLGNVDVIFVDLEMPELDGYS